jgi:hypothetical protein
MTWALATYAGGRTNAFARDRDGRIVGARKSHPRVHRGQCSRMHAHTHLSHKYTLPYIYLKYTYTFIYIHTYPYIHVSRLC